MRMIAKAATAVAFTAGLLATAGATGAQAQPATSTYEGCPAGYVCIYPNASWNSGHPSELYLSYGGHNLSNQYGVHRVFNNQTGGAHVYLCKGTGGTNCVFRIDAFVYSDYDLTPINSVLLTT
jgi:hypothetical protein